jgi:hypothetical protein
MSVSERASARNGRTKEDRTPAFLAFSKVGGGWQKIGAAWKWKSGEDGYSIQLTALPLNWDGRFVLAIPDKDPPSDGSDDER